MAQVLEIRRAEQLDSYRLIWDLLEQQSADSSFYRSWDWTRLWLERRRGSAQPRVMIVSLGSEVVGILPLCQTIRSTVFGKLRSLTLPVELGNTDCGPVGPNPMATMMAALRYLSERPKSWQMLELQEFAASRPLRSLGKTALRQTRLPMDIQHSESLCPIPFPQLAALAEAGLKRQAIDVSATRLVRFRPSGSRHGDGTIAPEVFAACREIKAQAEPVAEKTWGGLLPLEDPYLEILQAAARHGALDVALLYQNERPVGFAIHFCGQAGILHMVASGFVANRPAVEHEFWWRLAQDGLRREDRLAVFPSACGPKFSSLSKLSGKANFEIVQSRRGWQSRFLPRAWQVQTLQSA